MLSTEDKVALTRLVAKQALEDLQDVRDAYRSIELLLDAAAPGALDAKAVLPLLHAVGRRFDAELQVAHQAAEKLSTAHRCSAPTCCA